MTVLVYYIDFHWDNHQGGSGKSFESQISFKVPEDLMAHEIKEWIDTQLYGHCQSIRPFNQSIHGYRKEHHIQRIEIL